MERKLDQSSTWSNYQKIGFRFFLIYFLLFIVLMDWSVNPILSYLYYYGPLSTFLDGVISWVGKEIFQIPYTIISPYDGEHNDRTYVYLLHFIMVSVAILTTVVWSLLDRKRQNYQVLYYWLTTIIRYYLAFTMFLFALYKFFKVQFPDLGYYTLTSQVGDLSPMHLAWAFFGYSYEYNVFMGIAESMSLLLLFRRTTTLGALVTIGALANVIIVNYSYDVHAKLYPTVLLIMTLFLLLRDAKPIIRFFFTGQAISLPSINAPFFQARWMHMSKLVLKIGIIAYFLITSLKNTRAYKMDIEEQLQAKAEYSGVYDVQWFIRNNDTLSIENPLRWHQLILGDGILEAIRFKNDSVIYINTPTDRNELMIYGGPDYLAEKRQEVYNELGIADNVYYGMDSILIARRKIDRLDFEMLDSTTISLKGKINNESVNIIAKKRPLTLKEFRLLRRHFHWINEASYFY